MTLLLEFTPPKEAKTPSDYQSPPPGKWTYEDYCRLPEDGIRYEIIEGVLYMSPAPRIKHQAVSAKLFSRLEFFVEQHDAGLALYAPVDVMLPGLATPVQPDIVFVAKERLAIASDERIEGAPDLVVEVLSPSNWGVDRGKKAEVYAQAGVREYWIVDADARTIELFVLEKNIYKLLGKYGIGKMVRSKVLAGFAVKVSEVCPK